MNKEEKEMLSYWKSEGVKIPCIINHPDLGLVRVVMCAICKKFFGFVKILDSNNEILKNVEIYEKNQDFYIHNKDSYKKTKMKLGIFSSDNPYMLCHKCKKYRDEKKGKVWLLKNKIVTFKEFLKERNIIVEKINKNIEFKLGNLKEKLLV